MKGEWEQGAVTSHKHSAHENSVWEKEGGARAERVEQLRGLEAQSFTEQASGEDANLELRKEA